MGSPSEAAFVGVVLVVMFVALFMGFRTPETVVFMCLVLVWNVGIVSTSEALSGFSNAGMLAVGALFVAVQGVQKSQLADRVAKQVFGLHTSFRMGLLRMMLLCFFLSAFLNNTPVVALLIPIVRDWARTRGFAPSQFLIPMSFSCIFGGVLTIVGTSTNLVVLGLLEDAGLEPFGFFEPGYVGLPVGLLGIAYLFFFAPIILPKNGGLFRFIRDRADELITELEILPDFKYVGEPVSLVLVRLGLPPTSLIKIRRRLLPFGRDSIKEEGTGSPANANGNSQEECVSRWKENIHAYSSSRYRMENSNLWGCKDDLHCRTSAETIGRSNSLAVNSVSMTQDDAELLRDDVDSIAVQRALTEPNGLHYTNAGQSSFNAAVGIAAFAESLGNPSAHGRTCMDIHPVSDGETLQAGDVLFLSAGRKYIMGLQNNTSLLKLEGLRLLDVEALDLPGKGSDYFELVLSDRNRFVGEHMTEADFSRYYDCTVIAVRRRGSRDAVAFISRTGTASRSPNVLSARPRPSDVTDLEDVQDRQTSGAVDVSNRPFSSGDTVLVLAKEDFEEHWASSSQFFLITKVGKVLESVRAFDYVPLVFFVAMLVLVTASVASMVQSAMAVAAILVLGGWVPAKEAVSYVNWSLLLLIGSALGMSVAVVNSGMADYIGDAIENSNMPPLGVLFLIYAVGMIFTELITNNAAASLLVPVAIAIADSTGVSYKPLVMAVMISASSSFMTPIGYQTNTMVFAPGGYEFLDFTRVGFPLSCIYLVGSCLLIPLIFPF